MAHPSDPLIEIAVRPFAGNAEMQLAAAHLLREVTASNDDSESEAIHRWEAVDVRKRKAVWRIVLFAVVAVVSAIMLVEATKDILAYVRLYSSMTNFMTIGPASNPLKSLAKRLSYSQRLLLFGDSSKPTRAGQMKALWDRAPENPAYFGEYAKAYLSDNSALPPDFLETAHRIDPQNSWFTYLAAAVECQGSVEKRKQSSVAKEAGEARTWDIRDKAKLDRALVLLHAARSQPKCQNYVKELTRQRIEILPRSNPTDNTKAP